LSVAGNSWREWCERLRRCLLIPSSEFRGKALKNLQASALRQKNRRGKH